MIETGRLDSFRFGADCFLFTIYTCLAVAARAIPLSPQYC